MLWGYNYYLSDLVPGGSDGASISGNVKLNDNQVSIHLHPDSENGTCFSPADISMTIKNGKTSLVYDIHTDSIYQLTPERARQEWNKLSDAYKEDTGRSLPSPREFQNSKELLGGLDRWVHEYHAKQVKNAVNELKNAKSDEERRAIKQRYGVQDHGGGNLSIPYVGAVELNNENKITDLSQVTF